MRVIFLLLVINLSTITSQDIYKSIRILDPDVQKIRQIQKLGIALDHSIIRKGSYIDLVISDYEENILTSSDISYDVLIEDLTKY